jgi:hypothetical protein
LLGVIVKLGITHLLLQGLLGLPLQICRLPTLVELRAGRI